MLPEKANATEATDLAHALDAATRSVKAREDGETKRREDEAATRKKSDAMRRLAGELGERYSPARTKLDAYQVYHDRQREAVARLRGLDLGELMASGRGLLFYGTVGTGKDHLLAAMLYQAAWKHDASCRWVNGLEVYGAFRDRIDTHQRDEDYFRQLWEPQVLAISDPVPPVGNPSAWDTSNLYRLIDRRYRAMKSTWASMNTSSEADSDAKLTEPVFDRLREGAEVFACFWPSFRERRRVEP